MRYFPADAYLVVIGALGALSWTTEVERFRLGLPPVYEHMLAYALMAAIIIAAKGVRPLTHLETGLIIVMAAALEAVKYSVPFRHPKTSDFYADMIGLFIMLTLFLMLSAIARLMRRAIKII